MAEINVQETLRAWIGKLDDLYDDEKPLGAGHVLGLSNDLQTLFTQLTELERDREAIAQELRKHYWMGREEGTYPQRDEALPCSWEEAEGDIKRDYLGRVDAILGTQEQT